MKRTAEIALALSALAGAANADLAVVVPDTVYAITGQPTSIRYEQLCPQLAPLEYSCTAEVGEVVAYGLAISPPVGVVSVDLSVHDGAADATTTVTTRIVAIPGNTGSGEKAVLFVGDSLIAAKPWAAPDSAYIAAGVRAAFELGGGASIRLLGTQGVAPGLHEGHSGKRWVGFTSPPSETFNNPFWRGGRLDFQAYLAETGQVGPIDICVIHLGLNDVFCLVGAPLTDQAWAGFREDIDAFLTALLSPETGYPACQVVLALPASGSGSTDAWAACYGSLDNWAAFEGGIAEYRRRVQARYDGERYDPRVTVCATGLNVDRTANYSPTNYLHPLRSGYAAMAADVYAHLRALVREPATTAVVDSLDRPAAFAFPNPFNGGTRIIAPGVTSAAVYDIRGREVARLTGDLSWDGRDVRGVTVPSGAYFVALPGEVVRLSVVR